LGIYYLGDVLVDDGCRELIWQVSEPEVRTTLVISSLILIEFELLIFV
jgi:hypothetical protein